MTTELELQHRSEVADAKFGVADDLGWLAAGFAAAATHLKWDSWLLAVGAAVVIYILCTYPYRRDAAAAEDNYYRAAKRGKYYTES